MLGFIKKLSPRLKQTTKQPSLETSKIIPECYFPLLTGSLALSMSPSFLVPLTPFCCSVVLPGQSLHLLSGPHANNSGEVFPACPMPPHGGHYQLILTYPTFLS